MIEEGKIKRVELEFENRVYIATGKDAEEWLDMIASMEGLAVVHGVQIKFEWTKTLAKEGKK